MRRSGERCRLVALLRGGAAGFGLLVSSAAGLTQPLVMESPEARPTSQKISLDFKGVDIVDVLKLLSQQSGLNFVAGRNVTGRVTIFAKDVGVWEAFEIIIAANELAYEQEGELITVMTARDYELLAGEKFQERKQSRVVSLKYAKAVQLAAALNQLKSTLGQVVVDEASNTVILSDLPNRLNDMEALIAKLDQPTDTRIFSLNYAEAEKLKEKLQEFLTPGVGAFSVDARTNKVVVTDLEEVLPTIERIILAFDEQEGEVLIEAKIINVTLNDNFSLGVDWQQAFSGVGATTRSNFRVLGDIIGAPATSVATGAAVKLISSPLGNIQVVIEALKKFGKVETISNPRITVSNNQEAKILVGTKEAFVTTTTTVPATGSTVSSPQVQFVNVGTKLFVTPNIKRDGHIQLKIRPEVSEVSKTVTEITNTRIPIVGTTEAETDVLVKSGTTLIIGGLIRTKTDRTKSQVPILGDLPVVGLLFRSRVDKDEKQELVIFLTPQIISPNGERVSRFASGRAVERIARSEGADGHGVPANYQALIRRRLSDLFAAQLRSLAVKDGSVMMAFVLDRDGRVVGTPDISSPDGEAMVRAARDVLEVAAPFPPFPVEITRSLVRFQLTVESH